MKSSATLAQQIEDLTLHLQTVSANVRRASRELDAGFSRRLRRPLESSLRWRRYQDATDLLKIAEACLHDLQKVQALRLAPFSPGDQVVATFTAMAGRPQMEARYGIWDIEPGPHESYSYEVVEITKTGALFKRLSIQRVWPERVSLRLCDEALVKESRSTLSWRREVSATFIQQTTNVASLDHYAIEEIGWMRRRSVIRRI